MRLFPLVAAGSPSLVVPSQQATGRGCPTSFGRSLTLCWLLKGHTKNPTAADALRVDKPRRRRILDLHLSLANSRNVVGNCARSYERSRSINIDVRLCWNIAFQSATEAHAGNYGFRESSRATTRKLRLGESEGRKRKSEKAKRGWLTGRRGRFSDGETEGEGEKKTHTQRNDDAEKGDEKKRHAEDR